MRFSQLINACNTANRNFVAIGLCIAIVCNTQNAHAENIDAKESPLVFNLEYVAETWTVPSGGLQQGQRFMHNLDLGADADLDKSLGWRGARLHLGMNYTNSSSVSRDLTGDRQAVSSIQTGVETVRLYEAWIEQDLSNSLSVRTGVYDINGEFDVLETGNTFIGAAYGFGSDIAHTGVNGPSAYPTTGLGLRLKWQNQKGWAVRLAASDGVPGSPGHPKRLSLKLSEEEGAFLISEVQAPIKHGKLLLGAWHYTSEFDKISGGRSSGNHGFYLRGEAKLTQEEGNPDSGLSGFFRLGTSSGKFNPFNVFLSGGVNYKGLIRSRPKDTLGLAVAQIRTSKSHRNASGSSKAETHFELTYQAPLIKDTVMIQPVAHYIIRPNADPLIGNAIAIGLRLSLQLSSD